MNEVEELVKAFDAATMRGERCASATIVKGQVQRMNPGDVVRIPPVQRHWHGASPTTAMTHIAIQEEVGGKVVDWMEKVSDQQYRGTSSRP